MYFTYIQAGEIKNCSNSLSVGSYNSPLNIFSLSVISNNLQILIKIHLLYFVIKILRKPLKILDLSQVSFPLLFPLCYIVPPVFTNSDKGKYKGKKII